MSGTVGREIEIRYGVFFVEPLSEFSETLTASTTQTCSH